MLVNIKFAREILELKQKLMQEKHNVEVDLIKKEYEARILKIMQEAIVTKYNLKEELNMKQDLFELQKIELKKNTKVNK